MMKQRYFDKCPQVKKNQSLIVVKQATFGCIQQLSVYNYC